MSQLARMLIVSGLVLAGVGLLLLWGERLGLGRLPGDLLWKRKNTSVYFPIVTSLLVSVVLTVLLNLFLRRK
jgi:membrane protein implicated in regulation of membrane protease activity